MDASGQQPEVLGTARRVAYRGGERFPMQSVYKAPIAMAVLDRVDRGVLRLNEKVMVAKSDMVPSGLHSPIRDRYPGGIELTLSELVRLAVSESDGTASDVLLRLAGGPAGVTRYLRGIGVDQMRVATSEAEMSRGPVVQYRNWATPEGALAFLARVRQPLPLEFMTATQTGPRRIKGLLPSDTAIAHKTGTSGTSGGLTRATNDIGIVTLPGGRRLAIAVFVSDSRADLDTREGVIAQIARAVWDCWAAN